MWESNTNSDLSVAAKLAESVLKNRPLSHFQQLYNECNKLVLKNYEQNTYLTFNIHP